MWEKQLKNLTFEGDSDPSDPSYIPEEQKECGNLEDEYDDEEKWTSWAGHS
jgi:hypothetical protein